MKALVNDAVLRAELAKLEAEGAAIEAAELDKPQLPPTSARREIEYQPISAGDQARLAALLKTHGLELINDGAVYRIKRQRDFMIWTLETSPLLPEERGGGDAHAMLEAVRRFCEP